MNRNTSGNIWNITSGQHRTSSSKVAQSKVKLPIDGTSTSARHPLWSALLVQISLLYHLSVRVGTNPQNAKIPQLTLTPVILPDYLRMAQILTAHNTSVQYDVL